MFIFLIVILGLSLLILGHEAGHFAVAKLFKLRIDEFGFGFPPRILARKKGETEYSVNWLPFGGFVKIAGEQDHFTKGESQTAIPEEKRKRLFNFQPAWKRSAIILAGVFINFIIGWLLFSAVLMIGTPAALVVTGVQENSPAMVAGIQRGDIIQDFTETEQFLPFVDTHRGELLTLHIVRRGEELGVQITPRRETNENEGALGIMFVEAGEAPQSFFRALANALEGSLQIFWLTLTGLFELIKGLFTTGMLLEDIVGPVGIFSVAQRAGELSFVYLLQLIAIISINLSAINLIPFPALDGGRFLMIVIEKAKGSPISVRTETLVNTAGFALLIVLMIAITVRDIIRL